MWIQKMLRVVISGWAVALAVSVVPAVVAVSGEPFGNPAPISEQTHPDPNDGGGGCDRCQVSQ
ncbi:MAG: hypothetical protein GFH27_549281n355 [Chloroflexi bacterium AL-W]|nr:hypothetical protein [Chloroflexi bacterium AL-N1]NOK66240.1 hypothetical protein [Chloroflexi bacterium AL-N10]NOK73121.1 hypothetical protein [Chloroflexi bacterium AL-N5]NOK80018.1 hypothetical protein [Chloroflexi bacterium AL-W]NOK88126.1 hypothetical protein [Chloroflexi bacterium AL-N15]